MMRGMLRAEGLAVFALAVYGYGATGAGWLWFLVLFLVPDLSMLGYLAGPRTGSAVYNAIHTYVAPLGLLALGRLAGLPPLLPAGCLLAAHIGLDRFLGFGLKYPTAFKDTHIQRV